MTEFIKKLLKDKRVRFLITGGINTVVGYGFYALFIALGFNPYLATTFSTILGIINSYFWNKYFTFRKPKKSLAEVIKFVTVYLVSYILNLLLVNLFVYKLGFNAYVSGAVCLFVTTLVSYFGHNFYSFRQNGGEDSEMKSKRFAYDVVFAAAAAIAAALVGLIYFNFTQIDWNVPLSYSGGDGMFLTGTFKGFIESGSLLFNGNTGAPYGAVIFDFPEYPDFFNFIFMKIIYWLTGSIGKSINIYFFLQFPLTAVTTYILLRNMKVKYILSSMGGILFATIYFRFARNFVHYFLTCFWAVPLAVLTLVWIFRDDNYLALNRRFFKNGKNIFTIVFIPVFALLGLYYLFFYCFFLLVAILSRSIKKRDKKIIIQNICKMLIIFVLVGVTFLSAMLPGRMEQSKYGPNPEIPSRLTQESELYGIKLVQMFLPIRSYDIMFLHNRIVDYNTNGLLVNENRTAYLGVVGTIGFSASLVLIFIRKKIERDELELLSEFNIFGFLLGTVGGISSLFALFVSNMIRGYNRISVYLALFSIAVFCILGDMLLNRINKKSRIKYSVVLVVLVLFMCVGVSDQRGHGYANNCFDGFIAGYYMDDRFVNEIEETLGDGAMVYEMPYCVFPEHPAPNGMDEYLLFTPYIHSKTLKWSYGDYKGRPSDLWNREVSSLPLDEQIREVYDKGFRG
ncbi:MAG: GtrA family protein, partial [Clostridiales bacterium]|nr:GtrA family protein [Clostridiales bacterium]